jgi:hypothetical protein
MFLNNQQMRSNAVVDKTLRYTLLCACYVKVWYKPVGVYQAST